MPQMGVSVAEGTVVAWRVEGGETIAADETICDISTDKIDTEVPAPVSGVVAEILVDVDQTVSVGTVMARIGVEGDGSGGREQAPAPAAARASEAAPPDAQAPAREAAPARTHAP